VKDDCVYLVHIKEAIEDIREFTRRRTFFMQRLVRLGMGQAQRASRDQP
jgi:uncharacterized protein with HEPN domain